MRFPLFDLLRDLGENGEEFVRLLTEQIRATTEGARTVRDTVAGEHGDIDARERMREIEHEGDAYRAEVVSALSSALVTPLDREDLFRFSRAIDDILDHLRDFAIEWELYGVEGSEVFLPLLDASIEGMDELRTAVGHLVEDTSAISERALAAKTTGNKIRRLYQSGLADVLNDGEATPATEVVKFRELLRRLDIMGLRLRQAADVLADASVKRSH